MFCIICLATVYINNKQYRIKHISVINVYMLHFLVLLQKFKMAYVKSDIKRTFCRRQPWKHDMPFRIFLSSISHAMLISVCSCYLGIFMYNRTANAVNVFCLKLIRVFFYIYLFPYPYQANIYLSNFLLHIFMGI